MPRLNNLKYSCSYRNAPIYWGFSAHPSMEKSGRRIWVAEGEELGSNLNFSQWSLTTGLSPLQLIKSVMASRALPSDRLVWVEHGPAQTGSILGCGVDQAHLHV